MAEEINLLKGEDRPGLDRFVPKTNLPLYIALGVLVLEVLVWGGLEWYAGRIDSQINQTKQEVLSEQLKIEGVEGQRSEAVSFQARLNNLDTLLDKHLYWTPLFEELEERTLSQVRFETLEVSQSGRLLTITGIANDYSDLGKLIMGFESSPRFSDVVLRSSDRSQDETTGYSFNLEVSFDPKLLENN